MYSLSVWKLLQSVNNWCTYCKNHWISFFLDMVFVYIYIYIYIYNLYIYNLYIYVYIYIYIYIYINIILVCNTIRQFTLQCWYCHKMLFNNVRLMMHVQGHVDSEKQQNPNLSDLTKCKHCYKQFETPYSMQCHIEKVCQSYFL